MNDPLREIIELETPENVVVRFELAGLGRRALAAALDVLVLSCFSAVLVLIGFGVIASVGMGLIDVGAMGAGILLVVNFVVWWSYFIICEMTMNGQSVGKRKLRIRVARLDGGEVTFLHSALRNLLRGVDWLPSFYGIGAVTVLLTGKLQRLGDLVAGTVVIAQDPEAPPDYLLVDADRLPIPDEVRQGIVARVGALNQDEHDYLVRLLTRLPEYYLVHPADAQGLALQSAATLLARFQIDLGRALDYVTSVAIVQCAVAAYGRRAVAR